MIYKVEYEMEKKDLKLKQSLFLFLLYELILYSIKKETKISLLL